MSSTLHLDFESRSAADLTKVGQDVYAKDPTTEVLCAAYAFDDEPIELWTPHQPLPSRLRQHISSGGIVEAYNAPFEIAITNYVCTRRYGWPRLEASQAHCVMAMSYAMGLPGRLEGCAAALGIEERKDLAGGRLMLQMSKPREILPDGKFIWWEDPERLNTLYAYCRQDVNVERACGKRMMKLSPYERRVWLLDQKINNRGVTVDVKSVSAAIKLVEAEKVRLNNKMQEVSNGQIATCTAVQQIKDYLEFFGVAGESLDKAAVGEHLIDQTLHPTARSVLELRAEAGKAATSKFAPMVTRAGIDHRLRGAFQYSGANTRRWAGRGVQLHNLKRPTVKHYVIEGVIKMVGGGATAEEIDLCYGSPLSLLGECTRSFLVASPGKTLHVADFSAIEARVLAWLAGQESTLEVFRNGQDIYKKAAGEVYGCSARDVTDDQRQVGKVAVLALGYGGGVGAFQTMAKAYNVKMSPAFEYLWGVALPDQRIRAEKTWESNRKKYPDMERNEFLASDITKIRWREANKQIVEYWEAVENAAISAVKNPGQFFTPGANLPMVKFRKAGSFLWCQLPGGGVICYPYPEIKEVKTPWGALKNALTYMSEDGQSKQWLRFSTYGGSLAENLTQSVARDLLADAMLRLDAAGYDIVLHVHDEAVCDMPEDVAILNRMKEIMTVNPPWAAGLPIAASGFMSKRYRK